MSKFNTKTSNKTVNLAFGEAYKETSELELVSLLLTSFVEDKFYESADSQLSRLENLAKGIKDKKFLAQSAIYSRIKFGMRSISHALLAQLPQLVKSKDWVKRAIDKGVYRVDDATEILSFALSKFGKPIPNSLKKGLKLALAKFDSYELAKYRAENKDVKLVDLFNLVHPKAPRGLTKTYKALMEGELKSENTWETKLTKAGQTAKTEEEKEELKGRAWADLIKERKLGYFALLRNLRNIKEQAPEVLDEALKMLVNPKLIKSSLVLPFRFQTAIQEIEKISDSRKIITALNDALEISLSNVPKFDGKTLVVLDTSGSMEGRVMEIGSLFAAVLYKVNDADLMIFGDRAKYLTLNPRDSVATLASKMRQGLGGTDFKTIFQIVNKPYDRIVILSDMQGWIGYNAPTQELNDYSIKYGVNSHIFSFDLAGHGTLQFPQNKIYCLAGFSEKALAVMKLLEEDRNALINEIKKIEI